MRIVELHKKYIKGTDRKAIVTDVTIFLCHLTNAVKTALNIATSTVYTNTRVLKHMYDKKPAQEYEFLIENLHTIIKYPDHIYHNRDAKRGNYCFLKKLKNEFYLCSIEIKTEGTIFIVTAFRIADEKYLEKYTLLWSWRDDASSS